LQNQNAPPPPKKKKKKNPKHKKNKTNNKKNTSAQTHTNTRARTHASTHQGIATVRPSVTTCDVGEKTEIERPKAIPRPKEHGLLGDTPDESRADTMLPPPKKARTNYVQTCELMAQPVLRHSPADVFPARQAPPVERRDCKVIMRKREDKTLSL
jgi:hypothetical protein